jgi:hypothetical protein
MLAASSSEKPDVMSRSARLKTGSVPTDAKSVT